MRAHQAPERLDVQVWLHAGEREENATAESMGARYVEDGCQIILPPSPPSSLLPSIPSESASPACRICTASTTVYPTDKNYLFAVY